MTDKSVVTRAPGGCSNLPREGKRRPKAAVAAPLGEERLPSVPGEERCCVIGIP